MKEVIVQRGAKGYGFAMRGVKGNDYSFMLQPRT